MRQLPMVRINNPFIGVLWNQLKHHKDDRSPIWKRQLLVEIAPVFIFALSGIEASEIQSVDDSLH